MFRSLVVCFLSSWQMKDLKRTFKFLRTPVNRSHFGLKKINFKAVLKSSTSRGYDTSERREQARYRLEHDSIKIRIHKRTCNVLFVI